MNVDSSGGALTSRLRTRMRIPAPTMNVDSAGRAVTSRLRTHRGSAAPKVDVNTVKSATTDDSLTPQGADGTAQTDHDKIVKNNSAAAGSLTAVSATPAANDRVRRGIAVPAALNSTQVVKRNDLATRSAAVSLAPQALSTATAVIPSSATYFNSASTLAVPAPIDTGSAGPVQTVVSNLLGWLGIDAAASGAPVRPLKTPLLWAVLAVARELDRRLFNQPPAVNYDLTENSLTVDGHITGNISASDRENDAVTYQLLDGPDLGMLELNDDGSFEYFPTGDLAEGQTDQFTVRVSDDARHFFTPRSTTATITIAPVDDYEIAHSTVEGKTVATGSLHYAPGGDADLKYYVTRPGAFGDLTVDEFGNYQYNQTADAADLGLERYDHVNVTVVDAGDADGSVTLHTVRVAVALSDEDGLRANVPGVISTSGATALSDNLVDTDTLTSTDLDFSDYYTYTYDNDTSQTLMFAGFAVDGDETDLTADPGHVADYPVVGTMYQPGESATIKVEDNYAVYPVFIGLPNDDNTFNETGGVILFEAYPGHSNGFGCKSISAGRSCGSVSDESDGTEWWVGDGVGAEVIYYSDDPAKQADILNHVCTAAGATCTFTVKTSSLDLSYTDYGSDAVVSYDNSTGAAADSPVSEATVTNSTTYSVDLSSAQQDTVPDMMDTAISETLDYTVSDDWSKTYDTQITDVPAVSTGSLYAAYPIYAIEGDWYVTLETSVWKIKDTTYDVVYTDSDGNSLGDAEFEVSCADDGCGYSATEVDADDSSASASLAVVTTSESASATVDTGDAVLSSTAYTATGTILSSVDLDDVRGLALSVDGTALWATSYSGEDVVYLDTSDPNALGTVTPKLPLSAPGLGIVLNSDASSLYVAGTTAGGVLVYGVDDSVASGIAVGTVPTQLVLDESEGYLYVLDQGANTVDVVDLANNAVLPIGFTTSIPMDLAYGYDSSTDVAHLYVVDIEGNVSVYEGSSGNPAAVALTDTFQAGSYPSAMATTSDGQTLVVANAGDSTATIYDAASGETNTVTVGSGASDVVITGDGEYAFVANYHDDTITVIRLDSAEVAGTIDAGAGPASLAVYGSDGTYYVYVGNAVDDTIDVIKISISGS